MDHYYKNSQCIIYDPSISQTSRILSPMYDSPFVVLTEGDYTISLNDMAAAMFEFYTHEWFRINLVLQANK